MGSTAIAGAHYQPDYSSTKVYEKSDGKHKFFAIVYETYTDENRTKLQKQSVYGPVYGPKR